MWKNPGSSSKNSSSAPSRRTPLTGRSADHQQSRPFRPNVDRSRINKQYSVISIEITFSIREEIALTSAPFHRRCVQSIAVEHCISPIRYGVNVVIWRRLTDHSGGTMRGKVLNVLQSQLERTFYSSWSDPVPVRANHAIIARACHNHEFM